MLKRILSVLAALAVLVGGFVVTAPAQAVSGSNVYLAQVSSNETGYVRTWNTNNWLKRIYLGETAQNVERFCPPGGDWTMIVTGSTSTRTLDPGECYWPSHDGTYSVHLWNY